MCLYVIFTLIFPFLLSISVVDWIGATGIGATTSQNPVCALKGPLSHVWVWKLSTDVKHSLVKLKEFFIIMIYQKK